VSLKMLKMRSRYKWAFLHIWALVTT